MYITTTILNETSGLPEPYGEPPVAGYTTWYDFDDTDTVTVSGQRITGVDDKGSGAQDLTQTVAAVLLARALPSNRTAAFFTGAGYLSSGADLSDQTSSKFYAACLPTLTAFYTIFGNNADDGVSIRIDQTTGQQTTTFTDTLDIGTQSNASVTAGVPWQGGHVLSATDVVQYTNGVSETDTYTGATTAGRTLSLGSNPATPGLRPMLGWIGELLIYDTTLSSGDADLICAWMMDKWQIT